VHHQGAAMPPVNSTAEMPVKGRNEPEVRTAPTVASRALLLGVTSSDTPHHTRRRKSETGSHREATTVCIR
jgi:hypothetical protein